MNPDIANNAPAQRNSRSTLRDGRYVLCAPLGAGSQGATWEAVDKREGRPVAIKRFDVRCARSWKDVELAEREARVLSSLSHPKLPGYVEHFEEDGALYLVMEKVEGKPLSTLCKGSPLSEPDALRLLRDADDVLRYLHGRHPPVIHRDLKPANVLRRPDGSYAFVDFGAVRDRLRPEGGSTVVGTFGFMAPEQLQGRSGPATDVYAMGATVISALTGREPEDLPHRGLSIDVDAAVGTSIGRGLRATLASMLEPDPDRRASSISDALRGMQSTRPVDDFASELRQRFENELREHLDRSFGSDRHARRRARKAERRLRRMHEKSQRRLRKLQDRSWQHSWDHASGRGLARPMRAQPTFHIVAALALTFAQVAVGIALRAFVPLLLVLLSLVFGRQLRAASWRVRRAGLRAVDAIGQARHFVLDVHAAPPLEVRVDSGEGQAQPRVAASPVDELDDAVTGSSDYEGRSSRRGASRR
ncbi:MAG: serine/threonine-protein kinase [Polyangiaceae bacterium]